MATRRAEQKARTRAKVLEAARACFEADGYAATTIATVAARAGVAVGTVMAHFQDKAALVAAAFHDAIDEVVSGAIAEAPGGAPAIDRLLFVSDRLYRFYAKNRPLSVALVREATFPEGAHKEALGAQFMEFLAWVGGELAAGAERGELRDGLDIGVAALGYWADYYLVLLMGLMGGREPPEQAETLRALLEMRLT